MDSIFEKITLYDILGYLLPGGIFTLLSSSHPLYHAWLNNRELFESGSGYIILCLLLISYVIGVALSELAHILVRARNKDNEKIQKFLSRRNLDPASLINQSGIVAGRIDSETPLDDCFSIMYADIQTDPAYKRIHNYASAEVMSKNMFMALLTGGCFWIFERAYDRGYQGWPPFFEVVLILVIVILTALFWKRWKRFCEKKLRYTFLWFEEKVSGRENLHENNAGGSHG